MLAVTHESTDGPTYGHRMTDTAFHTVCPGSSDPFYILPYYIKLVTTSWTYSRNYSSPTTLVHLISPQPIQFGCNGLESCNGDPFLIVHIPFSLLGGGFPSWSRQTCWGPQRRSPTHFRGYSRRRDRGHPCASTSFLPRIYNKIDSMRQIGCKMAFPGS